LNEPCLDRQQVTVTVAPDVVVTLVGARPGVAVTVLGAVPGVVVTVGTTTKGATVEYDLGNTLADWNGFVKLLQALCDMVAPPYGFFSRP
jgi:hypothetical protein